MSKPISSVLFAGYTVKRAGRRLRTSGPVQPFIEYFVPRFGEVYVLEQPLPESEDLLPTLETYRNGVLIETRNLPRWLRPWWHVSRKRQEKSGTILRLKFRDVLSLLWAALTIPRPTEILVGVESVNAALGVLLRKLGRARKVVYYLFDFTPRRYASPLMNRAYLALDYWCCRHCDLVWNISEAYARARTEELHYHPDRLARQVTVNYGVDLEGIEYPPEAAIAPESLVFAGTVNRENGVDMLMAAFPLIRRAVPESTLLVLGEGRMLAEMKAWASRKGLSEAVEFRGMVGDWGEMTGLLSRCGIALAPYPDYPESTKKYGDVMKIRDYLACGLPVVTTTVPPIGKILEETGAGAVSRPEAESFAAAAISLVSDREKWRRARAAARELAAANTWEKNFSRGLAALATLENPRQKAFRWG